MFYDVDQGYNCYQSSYTANNGIHISHHIIRFVLYFSEKSDVAVKNQKSSKHNPIHKNKNERGIERKQIIRG